MAGIYIHIPFCKQKCSYCDFHFSTTFQGYRKNMIEALKTEIETRKEYLGNEKIQTLYFGGGTPSLLTKKELKILIDACYQNYDFEPEIEFTLEANPDDINRVQLEVWKELGVNRLSIGIQSFFQDDLDWMNRAHTVEEGLSSIQLSKELGFFLNLDLIYGLPNGSIEKLDYNIQKMIDLSPDHVSGYCLTVSPGTGLVHMIKTKQLPSVGEDQQADEFEYIVKQFKSAGYEQYEISNFARNNAYSKHNTNYWLGVKYLGIGPSAHSFDGVSRQWNVSNNHLYIKGVLDTGDYFEKEILTPQDQFNELILTGLRTKWGVNLSKLKQILPFSTEFDKKLKEFTQNELIFEENGQLLLTEKGKLQADYIASMLFVV